MSGGWAGQELQRVAEEVESLPSWAKGPAADLDANRDPGDETAEAAAFYMAKLPDEATIYISHLRRYPGRNHPLTRGVAFLLGVTDKPLAKGGMTLVHVKAEGRFFTGMSRCSNADNFNRAIGRQIALGRALKRAERYRQGLGES